MNAIEIEALVCGYAAEPVIRGVSLSVPSGEFLGVLGPNGSGKTTLLRGITRVVEPRSGAVRIRGKDVGTLTPREIACEVAFVMQDSAAGAGTAPLAFTVEEIVAMGRTPYLSRTGWETARDREAVADAMRLAEVTHLADRPIGELSGGERQRAFIALALAQQCDVVLLDEPTNHLDISHQVAVLNLFASLSHEKARTVVGVFHDLNLAAEYCDRILLLNDGVVAALGTPEQVLTADAVRTVYGAGVVIQPSPATGRPHVFLKR